MRIAAVSQVEMTVNAAQASAEILMTTKRLQAFILILTTLAGMLGLLFPVALIAADATSSPQVIHTLADHPGSTLLLTAGTILGLFLMLFPLRAGIARLGGHTRVQLADGQVTVERRGLFGLDHWTAPLAQFCGVTHHIRATLSGARHEIILVHPEPAKDVLLNLGTRHPKDGADHYAQLLGLAEIQPRLLYQRHRAMPMKPQAVAPPVQVHARAA